MTHENQFTPRAEEALRLAQEAAEEMGHGYVGCEHILLGLMREEDGIAHRVMQEYGMTEDMICTVLERSVGKGMSEVQENPLSGIKLVFFDHVALHRDAELENVLKLLARGRFVEVFEERMALEHRGLDDLRAAIVENGVGEGR